MHGWRKRLDAVSHLPALVVEQHPRPKAEASVSNRKGFSRSAKANTGAVIHFCFKMLKASLASGDKVTR